MRPAIKLQSETLAGNRNHGLKKWIHYLRSCSNRSYCENTTSHPFLKYSESSGILMAGGMATCLYISSESFNRARNILTCSRDASRRLLSSSSSCDLEHSLDTKSLPFATFTGNDHLEFCAYM